MSTVASPRASTTISHSRRTSATTDTLFPRVGPSSTTAPTQTQPSTRRNRAALRDYYNLKSPQGTVSSSTVSSPVASTFGLPEPEGQREEEEDDPSGVSELDRPGFSADEFISRLLSSAAASGTDPSTRRSSTSSAPTRKSKDDPGPRSSVGPLETLLRTEAKLVSDIRRLDAERKALVYDNYSKLIAASDTIGRVMSGGAGLLPSSEPSGPSGAVLGPSSSTSSSASASASASVTKPTPPAVLGTGNPMPDLGPGTNAAGTETPASVALGPMLAHIVETANKIRLVNGAVSKSPVASANATTTTTTTATEPHTARLGRDDDPLATGRERETARSAPDDTHPHV